MGGRGKAQADRIGAGLFSKPTAPNAIDSAELKRLRNSTTTAQAQRLLGHPDPISDLTTHSLTQINSGHGKDLVDNALDLERLSRNRNLSAQERQAWARELENVKSQLRALWHTR